MATSDKVADVSFSIRLSALVQVSTVSSLKRLNRTDLEALFSDFFINQEIAVC